MIREPSHDESRWQSSEWSHGRALVRGVVHGHAISHQGGRGDAVVGRRDGQVDKLVGVPWDPTGVVRARVSGGSDEGEHFIPAREVGEDGMPMTLESIPRSMYITSDMVKQYGPTPGCPQCRAVARADSSHHSMSHTQTCRVLIEEMCAE